MISPLYIYQCVVNWYMPSTSAAAGDNPLYQYAALSENLMRYCERMRERYFPETLSTLALVSPTKTVVTNKSAVAGLA